MDPVQSPHLDLYEITTNQEPTNTVDSLVSINNRIKNGELISPTEILYVFDLISTDKHYILERHGEQINLSYQNGRVKNIAYFTKHNLPQCVNLNQIDEAIRTSKYHQTHKN